jgi:hypothetical protein
MRVSSVSIGVVAIALISVPAIAGPGRSGPKATAPKAGAAPIKASAPKTHGSASAPKTHGGAPKTATGGAPKTHGGGPKVKTAATTTTAAAPTTTKNGQLNPIAQKVAANHGLAPKVKAMLPAGMTLNQASKGFKNQGQFIAALHVSQNLGIPFADLKTAMTGIRPIVKPADGAPAGGTTTPTEPAEILSLGQAIKKLRPRANVETAETTATKQATADLNAK